jgi:hypothetical protein
MAIRRQSYSPGRMHLYGLLKSSRVSFQIFEIPNVLAERGFPRNQIRNLQYFCDSLEFPGKNLNTAEYKISGLNRAKIPILRNYSEINLSFYHDMINFPMYEFFNTWIELAAPRDNVVAYYDDIVVKEGIELIQWEEGSDEVNFVVRLRNAYPIAVTSMQSNWGDDNFQKVNVSFVFEEFKVVDGKNTMKLSAPPISNIFTPEIIDNFAEEELANREFSNRI